MIKIINNGINVHIVSSMHVRTYDPAYQFKRLI